MEEKKPDRGGCTLIAIVCICLLVLLPVLYVLSTGPLTWLTNNGYLSREFTTAFYAPLRWACGKNQTVIDLIIWYDSFFDPNLRR